MGLPAIVRALALRTKGLILELDDPDVCTRISRPDPWVSECVCR